MELWLKIRLESNTCETIMAEIYNYIFFTVLDQTIRELLDRLHQVPHTIPNISGQSRTSYKQSLKTFIQTLIGDIVTHRAFNRAYLYEV